MQISKSRIAAGIVSFNPNIERLRENIQSVISQVESLVIIDNGSSNTKEIEMLCNDTGCYLIKLNENKGIAYALNQICKFFYPREYDWVFTLDQDSISSTDMVSKLYTHTSDNVGAIGPKIVYRNNETFSQNSSVKAIESVEWLITSATLTNLKAWKTIGGFDNKLFIDGVDKDFCFRLRQHGFNVIQCNEVELSHELGNLKCRRILGKTIYVTNHSPKRKYYMVRNAIYLDRKHNTNGSFVYILKIFIKTLAFEQNKILNLKQMLQGIKDGKKMMIKEREF